LVSERLKLEPLLLVPKQTKNNGMISIHTVASSVTKQRIPIVAGLMLWFALCIVPVQYADAASFNCKQPQSVVEHLICSDAELSAADTKLAQSYTTLAFGSRAKH